MDILGNQGPRYTETKLEPKIITLSSLVDYKEQMTLEGSLGTNITQQEYVSIEQDIVF